MGGAERTKEAASCLMSSPSLPFFVKSNTSLVFSLQWLQVGGPVPADLRAAAPFFTEPTGLRWSALVWLAALSACTGLARLNEPAPFCSLCH